MKYKRDTLYMQSLVGQKMFAPGGSGMKRVVCLHLGGSPLQGGSAPPLTVWAASLEQKDAWWGGAWASKHPEKRSIRHNKKY